MDTVSSIYMMPVYKNDFLLIKNKIGYYDLDFSKNKKNIRAYLIAPPIQIYLYYWQPSLMPACPSNSDTYLIHTIAMYRGEVLRACFRHFLLCFHF